MRVDNELSQDNAAYGWCIMLGGGSAAIIHWS